MTEKLAYTQAEAAELLGVSESYVRDAVTARKIPHRRYGKGRIVRFTLDDLRVFLDSCAVDSAEPITKRDVVELNSRRRAS